MASTKLDRLRRLREVAQSHLAEIEADKSVEEDQQAKSAAEIRQYAKMSSFERRRLASKVSDTTQITQDLENLAGDATGLPKTRFTPFKEILHRLRWDPELNIEDYVVGYLERFEGLKETPANSWIADFSEEEWIPMHRVRYVKRITMMGTATNTGPALGIVWDRDGRLDYISGQEIVNRDDLMSVETSEGGVVL